MLKYVKLLLILSMIVFSTNAFCMKNYSLKSPDGKIIVKFFLTPSGEPLYSVSHSDSIILKESKLGVIRSDGNFISNLSLDSVSNEELVADKYTLLHGKRLNCTYAGNKKFFI